MQVILNREEAMRLLDRAVKAEFGPNATVAIRREGRMKDFRFALLVETESPVANPS